MYWILIVTFVRFNSTSILVFVEFFFFFFFLCAKDERKKIERKKEWKLYEIDNELLFWPRSLFTSIWSKISNKNKEWKMRYNHFILFSFPYFFVFSALPLSFLYLSVCLSLFSRCHQFQCSIGFPQHTPNKKKTRKASTKLLNERIKCIKMKRKKKL